MSGTINQPPPPPIINADRPLMLFPVRLETRFFPRVDGGAEIRIRVYPDKIHIDTHEPELTTEELTWGKHFWEHNWRAANDEERKKTAFRQLAERFDAQRAAWIVKCLTPLNQSERPTAPIAVDKPLTKLPQFPNTKMRADSWTRAPLARVLPDHWIAVGYVIDAIVASAQGNPIPDILSTGPDPNAAVDLPDDQLQIDEGMKWMVDFEAAEKVGMGLRLNLPAQAAGGLDRLLVFGVKKTLDANQSAARLAELFDAHNYTDGLSFLRPGMPTNNTTDGASGYDSSDPGFDKAYRTACGEPLFQTGDGSNGDATAKAAGLPADIFNRVWNADNQDQIDERRMNTALWQATWGYFLRQMMEGVFTESEADANLAWGRRHFIDFVRAGGPLPAIRIGKQPYGMLPVTSLNLWQPRTEDGAQSSKDAAVRVFLMILRDVWRRNTANVPRLGGAGDPDQNLINVLKMDATATYFEFRGLMGRHYVQHLWPFLGVNLTTSGWFNKHAELVAAALQNLGLPGLKTWLNTAVFAGADVPLKGPLVQRDPLPDNARLSPNYLELLLSAPNLAAVRDETFPDPKPNTLLYLLLRHSMLLEYVHAAANILISKQGLPPGIRREAELVDITRFIIPTITAKKILAVVASNVSPQPLEVHLHQLTSFTDPTVAQLGEFRESLKQLKDLSIGTLGRLLTGALDLCSHRLDAWISSYATKRLALVRNANPTGVYLGGYGWVENLRPAGPKQAVTPIPEEQGGAVFQAHNNPGFVQAPSLTQAAAVAVLRSGHLTHSNSASGNLLAIDLSSDRVRLAKWLLDGVRQGQPLGALLGYRFERGLHENLLGLPLDRFIKPFREIAPLVARKLEQTDQALESIAANNVVDGLKLQRMWVKEGPALFNRRHELPQQATNDMEFGALVEALNALNDAVDAVSDALMAESVYQTVKGNPSRAAATLDAVARGEAPPPELEVVDTPRTGIALTHRFVVLFGGNAIGPPDWPLGPQNFRALAEPHLNAWAARLLGNPKNVRLVIEKLDPVNNTVAETKEIRLSELGLTPLDLIYSSEDSGETSQSELDQRILMFIKRQAGGFPADALLRINPDRSPGWSLNDLSYMEFLELVRAARKVMTSARALNSHDLIQGEAIALIDWDLPEIQARQANAIPAFRQSHNELQRALAAPTLDKIELMRDLLIRLANFGVSGAIPVSPAGNRSEDLDLLIAQAKSVVRETLVRVERLLELEKNFNSQTATVEDRVSFHLARLREVFGKAFVVMPRFKAANPVELEKAFADSSKIQEGDPLAVVPWFQRAARVRVGMNRFDEALKYAEAVGTGENLNLKVAQLPFRENDRWVALPLKDGTPINGGCLSIVAQTPAQLDVKGQLAGLLIDEWVETVPNPSETTGVVFQYDQPNSTAPQAILLALPPNGHPTWSVISLRQVLLETLELAKIRAVDPDLLGETNHFLPALYFALNADGETITSDFMKLSK